MHKVQWGKRNLIQLTFVIQIGTVHYKTTVLHSCVKLKEFCHPIMVFLFQYFLDSPILSLCTGLSIVQRNFNYSVVRSGCCTGMWTVMSSYFNVYWPLLDFQLFWYNQPLSDVLLFQYNQLLFNVFLFQYNSHW